MNLSRRHSHSVTLGFQQYDPSTRGDFDEPTHTLLVRLASEFGTVEIREITESAEWCVRIFTPVADEKSIPLAALGETPFAAAHRLVRICGLRNSDGP